MAKRSILGPLQGPVPGGGERSRARDWRGRAARPQGRSEAEPRKARFHAKRGMRPSVLQTAFLLLLSGVSLDLFAQTGGLRILVEENNGALTIVKSQGSAKTLVIPETIDNKPVTAIGDGAFVNRNLTSVTIPDSVTVIGDGAFAFNNLTAVVIGGKVSSIGRAAFANNQLSSLTLGAQVATIGKGAFANNQLPGVAIPDSVTLIDDYAFFFNKIRKIAIPSGVKRIGEGAFSGNRLVSIEIGAGVTDLGDGAFFNNHIITVTVPPGVDSMGKRVVDVREIRGVKPSIDYVDAEGNVVYTSASNFDTYYASTGKRAGKYTFADGTWTLGE